MNSPGIRHRTVCGHREAADCCLHSLMLRPRESRDFRLIDFALTISTWAKCSASLDHRGRVPDPDRRAPHSILALQNSAVATSGDYRHRIEVQGCCLSHTTDPDRGAPMLELPASVSVVALTCADAEARAIGCMVKRSLEGGKLARSSNLSDFFIDREGDLLHEMLVGRLFEARPDPERLVDAGVRTR